MENIQMRLNIIKRIMMLYWRIVKTLETIASTSNLKMERIARKKIIKGGIADPTASMEQSAEKAGTFVYELQTPEGNATQHFNKIQILTSQEIIDGKYFIHPPTLSQMKNQKRNQGSLI